MKKNLTSPMEFIMQVILIFDFKYNSLLENIIKISAKKTIKKVANKATIDHN